MLDGLATRWLAHWHGAGEPHQWQYYRCEGCHGLVTWRRIRQGGCGCGLSNRIRPARLTFAEKARCLLLPWSLS